METPNLSDVLSLAPPPGITPNFVNPPTRESLPKITAYITLPPMLLFLVLRFYTRLKFTALGADDYLCALAAAAIVANTGLSFAVCGHPAGPHQWDIPVEEFTMEYAKFELAASYTYFVAAIFIKVSILMFYLRIFGIARYANWLIWTGIISTVILYTVITIFLTIFCVPRHEDYASGGIFSPQSVERCLGVSGWATFITGIVSVIIDAYVLAIPLGFLTQLNASRKRRASLCALFAVGFSALEFSIVGAIYRSRFLFGDLDSSWSSMYVYAAQIGEINLGIISSCMPIIFALSKSYSVKATSWVNDRWLPTCGGVQMRSSMSLVDGAQPPPRLYEQGRTMPLQIPTLTLTRLRSWANGLLSTPDTRPRPTEEIVTTTSFENSYHIQLREECHRGSASQGS